MHHLFSSRVKVQRLHTTSVDGVPEYEWNAVSALMSVPCRLDLNFLRQGKDQPMPVEAGRAPDRIGVMFCAADVPFRVGDRIVAVSGPIHGTFEIRVIPDIAQDFGSAHHIEVQIVEVSQVLASYNYSGA